MANTPILAQTEIAKALGLKRSGSEYKGPCPLCGGNDRFHVRQDGLFGCRQCGDANRKELYKAVLQRCGHTPRGNGDRYTPRPQSEDDTAPPPKKKSVKTPAKRSTTKGYHSLPEGANVTLHEYSVDFAVVRHDLEDGKKSIRPWIKKEDGKWYSKRPDDGQPLPLYGHWELYDWPDRPVVVVEGEKCRDALWQALGQENEGRLPVCYAFGSHAWDKSDWSQVAGRDVLLLADADAPGRKAFVELGRHLQGMGCTVSVAFPEGDTGEDVADWLLEYGSRQTFRKIKDLTQPLAAAESSVQSESVGKMALHEAVDWSVLQILSKGERSGICCVGGSALYVCDPTTGLWIEMTAGYRDWGRYADALYSVVVGHQYHSMVTSGRKFTVDLRDTLEQRRRELTQISRTEWNRTTRHPLLPLHEGGCWHMLDGCVMPSDDVRPLYIERSPAMRLVSTPRPWEPEAYADQERGSVWLDQWGDELVTRFARNLVYGPGKHMDIMVQPTSNWGKGAFMDVCQDAFPGMVTQSDPMTLLMPAGGRFDTLREKLAWAHVVYVTEVRDHEITPDRIVAVTESLMEFERKGEPEEQRLRKGTLMLLNTEDVNLDFEMQGIVNRTPWILDLSDDERTMETTAYRESCAPGKTSWFLDYVCEMVRMRASLEPTDDMAAATELYRAQRLQAKAESDPEEVKAVRALYAYTGQTQDCIVQSEMKTEMAGYLGLEEEDLPQKRAWTQMLKDAFPAAHKVAAQRRRMEGGLQTVHEGFTRT